MYLKQYDFELAIIPPVGGSGYPAFYENSRIRKPRRRQPSACHISKKCDMSAAHNPRLYSVAANGHVLSGENAHLNKFMCWPANNNEPFIYLQDNTGPDDMFRPVIIPPGTTIDLETYGGCSYEEVVAAYDNESERTRYIEDVAARVPYFFDDFDMRPSIDFEKLFRLGHERMAGYLKANDVDVDMTYVFPFRSQGISKYAFVGMQAPYDIKFSETNDFEEKYLEVKVDERALYFLLTGGFSWNIADATGFITYDRQPDFYDYDTYIALNFLRL